MGDKTKNAKDKPSRVLSDVVGIELGAGLSSGTPVARVRRTPEGRFELLAAGYLPLVSEIPVQPTEGVGGWVLPRQYHAPSAALAIASDAAVLRQASRVGDALSEQDKNRYRADIQTSGAEGFSLVAGLPDAIGVWASGLLPEGRKPTACSLQVSRLASINAFAVSLDFSQTGGTALLLHIGARTASIVIYHEYKMILYREHAVGSDDVVDALCQNMNLDRGTVEKILEDDLVDPTPVLDPILWPLFRQTELSTDHALRKNGCFVERFFLSGLSAGARYWTRIFNAKTGGTLAVCNPLDGFPRADNAQVPDGFDRVSVDFVPAVGAAVAVLEDA